ncbi:MAG: hypothetical protein A3C90_04290 [Candidatus Magasanikbacteria bacterium RIFCSPHIGHO2_02_FULL_51_14]|uniref:Uncharacterized protein n=1 Tax=Candidatus Magasanikbacteria bacterium RIFCSPHIGHO2_02_FULL_51_14 TaxID=1798683 RepID=A0A1F6MDB2_9BACT|nr:MAG: hypothetical protein A3C90_04290 [Candidatus Magasanikbacteria bacterium RIFCSPHIGHO2_02_FULL_51_14]
MTRQNIIDIFKKYQKTSPRSKKRRNYFSVFEKRMIYRTTKTENPETTKQMVRAVLEKMR